MTSRASRLLLLCALWPFALSLGCHSDPPHPAGAAAIGQPAGPVVATVDGHAITLAEAEEFAATREDPTVDALLDRESAVRMAAESEFDVELVRKQAMVRALLADEIEAKVGIDTLDDGVLDKQRRIARAELKGYAGFNALTFRIANLDLLTRRAELSDDEVTRLRALVRETAQKLYDQIPTEDALQAAENLDWSWVDPEVRVERKRSIQLLEHKEVRKTPYGWIKSPDLARNLAEIPDGAKSELIEVNKVPLFAVRRSEIPRPQLTDEQVEAIAVGRSLRESRTEALDKLVAGLQRRTSIEMNPELLKEPQ